MLVYLSDTVAVLADSEPREWTCMVFCMGPS